MQVITPLIQFQQQMRIFHWQSDTYAQHEAFGRIYKNMDELIDTFIENYMGIFGKSKPTTQFSFVLEPFTDENLIIVLDSFEEYLKEMQYEFDYTDLLNIRDSMLSELNTLKYLLTLR
jgi:hypothetical protein